MIRFKQADERPSTKPRPAKKIVKGLKEAIAFAKGTEEPIKDPKGVGRLPETKHRAKKAISIRLDQDLIDHFKAGGDGWQSRMNDALRKSAGFSQ